VAALQKYGLVIVKEYLSHELGKKLEAKLGLPVEEKVQQKALVTRSPGHQIFRSKKPPLSPTYPLPLPSIPYPLPQASLPQSTCLTTPGTKLPCQHILHQPQVPQFTLAPSSPWKDPSQHESYLSYSQCEASQSTCSSKGLVWLTSSLSWTSLQPQSPLSRWTTCSPLVSPRIRTIPRIHHKTKPTWKFSPSP
jgi:hypothetical protein